MIYGYAQVSTDGQSVEAQVSQLRAAGSDGISRETASEPRPTASNYAAFSASLVPAIFPW